MIRVLLLILCLVGFGFKPFDGTVERVIDGDTFVLDSGIHIRLSAADSPEKKQQFGPESLKWLKDQIEGKVVTIRLTGAGSFSRLVARVTYNGKDLTTEAIRNGYCWRSPTFDKAGEFTALEKEARDAKRGLWAYPKPIPPWEFRKK